ncbi:MAG: DEAD/DEAH box helicase family protein [Fulvivirga sp.]|uniref:DEAD/DEAH box helicase family protein n=1 Tax=Fulvivirga sp. TaxID=1931237 RepID=UPI0032EBB16D
MNTFPKNIKFIYPWRSYQERVLSELKDHLIDDHLHVVAPPGSGKTVLGLEVMLRLNKPTLILAPTVAIKNQWVHRFCELFIPDQQIPDWISFNLKNPKFLTVSTYQGLHSMAQGRDDIIEELEEMESQEFSTSDQKIKRKSLNELIVNLKEHGLGTIVIDEAHHLKNEWWKTLMKLKNELNPTIVGLTATPPYDVTHAEWNRYLELNGPVDTEITVPELIKEGDLCPHQDYVYLSSPNDAELAKIKAYRERIRILKQELMSLDEVFDDVVNTDLVKSPLESLDWIYSNMELYSSILIYLNTKGHVLGKDHFKITGNSKKSIPKLTDEWFEIFLEYYTNKLESENVDIIERQKTIISKIKRAGALDWGKINFSNDKVVESYLTSSISKLNSIDKIISFEENQLKDDLRGVILGDYIRQEYLSNDLSIDKIGIIPIFELLRRKNVRAYKLGVLTGSLVIIPKSSLSTFNRISATYSLKSINSKALHYDENYILILVNDAVRHNLVHIVTQVFELGEINILIGTKSLLGEGWDAPSVNVLILASYVGSFVLSNQMRGRAIRTERGNSQKTGNIWHLACYDPTESSGGKEIEILRRRFRGFLGISEREDRTIENGLNRLLLPDQFNHNNNFRFNERMFNSAKERELLKSQWHEAIYSGTYLVEEIRIPFENQKEYGKEKKLYTNKTIKYVLAELGMGIAAYTLEFIQQLPRFRNILNTDGGLLKVLYVFLFGFIGFFAFKLYHSIRMFLRYRDISKDIREISMAVARSLIETGQIHTLAKDLEVKTTVNDDGEIFIHLNGGTTYEKSLFIESIQTIISPIENPRYIIIRKNWLGFLKQRDYHAVPDSLGKHKSVLTTFVSKWRHFVGSCDYIFTRTPEGRATLLKARFESLSSEFQDESERINRWK